ncbi:hypothetical protein J0383_07350 [Flavobacterium endoglycinae]|uniref:Uncharacterized protein n=1 Tax=Flavobacterium endoglycinae TaxID=2816357 RepID=A0ABX7QHS6_9FLAO|nr:hypothetical protein [Flavobacterium endoglycinae]QSW90619.1 hypothetical protein J0383_07350 [Flavobacterium endoglycinae]
MKTNEIQNLEHLRKLINIYFRKLKSSHDQSGNNIAEIKFVNYYELGCVITNLLKMCILALDHEPAKKQSINVSLILETVLEMFPLDEFEFLSEISEMYISDSNGIE